MLLDSKLGKKNPVVLPAPVGPNIKDPSKSKEDYAAYAVSNHINKVEFIEE